MNSNVVGPNQIIKVGPMQVDKLSCYRKSSRRVNDGVDRPSRSGASARSWVESGADAVSALALFWQGQGRERQGLAVDLHPGNLQESRPE